MGVVYTPFFLARVCVVLYSIIYKYHIYYVRAREKGGGDTPIGKWLIFLNVTALTREISSDYICLRLQLGEKQ